MSPRFIAIELHAARERIEKRQDEALWLAYQIAAFQRAKRLRPYKHYQSQIRGGSAKYGAEAKTLEAMHEAVIAWHNAFNPGNQIEVSR